MCLTVIVSVFSVSCNGDTVETTGNKDPESTPIVTFEKDPVESTPAPDDNKIKYTVTVTDTDGNPIEGVQVQICIGDKCMFPKNTNTSGVVEFDIEETSEPLSLKINKAPEGYALPEGAVEVDAKQTEITVKLNKNA